MYPKYAELHFFGVVFYPKFRNSKYFGYRKLNIPKNNTNIINYYERKSIKDS